MSFTGADYHQAFEEACTKLQFERDPNAIRSELEGIEWVLWEAVREVFFHVSIILACLIVLPMAYLTLGRASVVETLVVAATVLILATAVYWLIRLAFHFEVSVHIKGRTFGSGGME